MFDALLHVFLQHYIIHSGPGHRGHLTCCDGAPLRGDRVGGCFMSFGRVFLLLSLFEVFYVFAMSVRGSRDCHFGGYAPLRSLGPRYLFVGCFYFWLFLLLDLCFLFETRCSCDLEGFLLLRKTLFSFILCSN